MHIFQESEHRTSLLRDKAQQRKGVEDEKHEETDVEVAKKPDHINFFQQFEEGVRGCFYIMKMCSVN